MRPPLFEERTQSVQIALGVVGPIAAGVLAGLLLGASKPAYLAFSVLALAGAVLAGLEHRGAGEGALRGLGAGLLFGAFILATKAATGAHPKATLPHPEGALVVLTTLFSVGAGALGGLLRGRRESAPDRGH